MKVQVNRETFNIIHLSKSYTDSMFIHFVGASKGDILKIEDEKTGSIIESKCLGIVTNSNGKGIATHIKFI